MADEDLLYLPDYIKSLITGTLSAPSDDDLAHLMAIVADERARALRTLLWLIKDSPRAHLQLEKLWQLAVDAATESEGAYAVLSALRVQTDLDALKAAVADGSTWSDPAEVLDPQGTRGVNSNSLLCLAQQQLVERSNSGKPRINGHELDQVVVRLFHHLDEVQTPVIELDNRD